MFKRYLYEHPNDEMRRVGVGIGGYVMAALAGSLYVWWKAGWSAFTAALLPHVIMMLALIAATGVTSLALSGGQQLVALLVVVPGLLAFQSMRMVRIVDQSYRGRGWIVHQF